MNRTIEPIDLLIVEDDAEFRETLALEFRERGYRVWEADGLEAVRAVLGRGVRPRFAVVDLRIGEDNGLDVVGEIAAVVPDGRSVILTGYGSLPTAVAAVKSGASNYLAKPVSIERLERALWTDDTDPREVAVPDRRESLARHEREYVEYVLHQCEGNVSQAARWLGIHRQSLQRKLRKFTPS